MATRQPGHVAIWASRLVDTIRVRPAGQLPGNLGALAVRNFGVGSGSQPDRREGAVRDLTESARS